MVYCYHGVAIAIGHLVYLMNIQHHQVATDCQTCAMSPPYPAAVYTYHCHLLLLLKTYKLQQNHNRPACSCSTLVACSVVFIGRLRTAVWLAVFVLDSRCEACCELISSESQPQLTAVCNQVITTLNVYSKL